MAECLVNFFDRSPLSPLPSPEPPPPRHIHDSPHLELTLSLSVSSNTVTSPSPPPPPPHHHHQQEPYPSPSTHRSDDFVSPSLDLPSASSAPPESAPFLPSLPSRDQIWSNLQTSSSSSSTAAASALPPNLAAPPSCSNASTRMEMESLWNRRSASVQVLTPSFRDLPHSTAPVRSRSFSHGILQHLPPPPLPHSAPSLMPDRHAARVDSDLLPRNNLPPAAMEAPPPNDLTELQNRREIQAQRRLQARKRRRSLMEEKQSKKGVSRPENGNAPQRLKTSVSADEKFLMQASHEMRHDPGDPDSARYGCRSHKLASSASSTHEYESGTEKFLSDSSRHVPEKASSGSVRHDCGTETKSPSDSIQQGHGAVMGVSSDSVKHEYGADTRISSDSSRNDQGTQRTQWRFPMETSADADGLASRSQGEEGPTETISSEQHDVSVPDQSGLEKHVAEGRISMTMSSAFTTSMPDRTNSSNMAYPLQSFPLMKASSVQENMLMSYRCNSLISSEGWRPSSSACSASNSICTDQGQGEGREDNSAFSREPVLNNNNLKMPMPDGEARVNSSAQQSIVNLKASAFCKFGGSNKEGCMMSLPIERQQSWPAASLPHAKPVLSSNQCLPMCRSPYTGLTEAMKQGNSRSLQDCEPAESSRAASVNKNYSEFGRQKSVSFSDLPSVTTTGRGPLGRTISGVMYITNARKVQLICNCHGKHMSPVEFVAHSGSSDLSNPERSIVVNPCPLFNQVASTPV